MPLDTPLILTHDHDPNVVFRGPFLPQLGQSVESPRTPVSYDELWTNFQHLSRAYHNLLTQHRELSDARNTLQTEHKGLRDSYNSLASKHQEFVDDAINTRIQSWRYVVRVEELEKELRLLRQGDAHSLSIKRKYDDIHDGDKDAAESDWSASSRSHSQSPSNDTFTTPASSKIASTPLIKRGLSDDNASSRALLVTPMAEFPCEPSDEIRTPKRRRGSNYDHDCAPADAGAQQPSPFVTPIGKPIRPENLSLETNSRLISSIRPSPLQIRLGAKSFRHRSTAVVEQNATAAAVAAALSGTAVSYHDRSSSPSPAVRHTL
ncbi:hypothetical protein D9756_003412 [Leucocoprinus leucothites]|uniref:Uncharacterized protein n=1 Tax=Leucocoprinus leucothites TaxID=201217 RepID=A0A8H5G6G2_9AGAR|nr:hypothetical protein D9756_003412 [Leucoagaricus leucothites]